MRAQGPLIIHPERQSNVQRFTFSALTAAIWAAWIYLWLPLVTTALWVIGLRFSYMQLFMHGRGFDGRSIVIAAFTCGCVACYWSIYNYLRYGKRGRRKGAPDVTRQAIGEYFGVTNETVLLALSSQRRIELQFDSNGQILSVSGVAPGPDQRGLDQPTPICKE